MFRNTLGYIVGIVLFGSILAFAVSMLINVLQYVAVGAAVLLPFWGAYRRKKNWTHEHLGLKRWLGGLRKAFKLRKLSLTYYLVAAVVVGFTYEQITIMAGYIVGGIVSMLIIWESVRYVVLKVRKIELLSFSTALKSAW